MWSQLVKKKNTLITLGLLTSNWESVFESNTNLTKRCHVIEKNNVQDDNDFLLYKGSPSFPITLTSSANILDETNRVYRSEIIN